jgi:hypothetical protein
MGYICPQCGEGLPEEETCPCTMGPDDAEEMQTSIRGPLTSEIASPRSPVRQFLDERFSGGLPDLQRRCHQSAPSLSIPAVPRAEANPGTIGTAADWLLRFLLHPRPSLRLAAEGAVFCSARKAAPSLRMLGALGKIAASLGLSRADVVGRNEPVFTGPMQGNEGDHEHLARVCWALALLTEISRRGSGAPIIGPLAQFQDRTVCDCAARPRVFGRAQPARRIQARI